MNPKIITIGDTGTGGWWYAINHDEQFADGFDTEERAIEAAIASVALASWEIWYACDSGGRTVMVPGAKSAAP